MILKYKPTILLTITLFISLKIVSQDQLVLKNQSKKYVDKIIEIKDDSISYKNFKKTYKISSSKLKGYYLTIQTKENLEKRFYKRNRVYYPIANKVILASKLNPNEPYINRRLKALNKFKPENFQNGYFIQNGDTNKCKIFLGKKNGPDNYLFMVTLSKDGTKTFYLADEIEYYSIGKSLFKSYMEESEKIKTPFFLKLIESGKFFLYERNEIPSDNHFTYYIRNRNEDFFSTISPFSNSSKIEQPDNSAGKNDINTKLLYKSTDDDIEFKTAITNLFGDCASVRNKVISGFYSKPDIPKIIREYNHCKTSN
jgi:hypothetical protein